MLFSNLDKLWVLNMVFLDLFFLFFFFLCFGLLFLFFVGVRLLNLLALSRGDRLVALVWLQRVLTCTFLVVVG